MSSSSGWVYAANFSVSMDKAWRWQDKRREQQGLCQEAVDSCVDGYMFLDLVASVTFMPEKSVPKLGWYSSCVEHK